jgi:hypothetical protein
MDIAAATAAMVVKRKARIAPTMVVGVVDVDAGVDVGVGVGVGAVDVGVVSVAVSSFVVSVLSIPKQLNIDFSVS